MIRRADFPLSIVVIAVLLLSGCASDSPTDGPYGRVSGTALAGPTCPVEQPGVLNCEPKPVQGIVQFNQDDDVVGTARINANGDFVAEIPVGIYTVTIDIGDNIFPICSPIEVEVRADVDAVIEINCDTGIR